MDFSKISVELETDEVEKFLKYFYKSEKGIDIIKLSQEITNANFYFTKTLQNLLLDIIKENKSNEKIELNFEDIKNKSKDNFYIIDSELKIFLGYKIFLQKNENVTQKKQELIQMLYETLNIDLKEILLKNSNIISLNDEEKIKKEFTEFLDDFNKFCEKKYYFEIFDDLLKSKDEYKTIFIKYASCILLLNNENVDENKINIYII